MKIICSKSSLLKSVSIALKAVPSKTTMPILECILMDATTNQIKFTTNDMELGIETIVDGHIEEKGMVALDAKIFYEIIRRLPDNDVTITTDSNYVATITCEKAKFTIPGKAGEDFAYLPVIEKDESLTLSQFTLKEMIRQTGNIQINKETGMIQKGVIVRHLVLPGHVKNSKAVIKYLLETYKDQILISIMNQYTPMPQVAEDPLLSRKVTKREYEKVIDYALELGMEDGFIQEGEAAKESFIPEFNLEGIGI